jgi:hypothetical protein
MTGSLADIVDLSLSPLPDIEFRAHSKRSLDKNGALVMPRFLQTSTVEAIQQEGPEQQHLAYYTVNDHNIFLTPPDPAYANDHPRNRLVSSSKGCIAHDQIPSTSALNTLYDAEEFREFLCAVLGEDELHKYADKMSSINLHYADEDQELGWHFDNSSFAITLMIQTPEEGGVFEYVKDVRDADSGNMNYDDCGKVLAGDVAVQTLTMDTGTLVLFRGRNSMHRVTPAKGMRTRMLVVMAYNAEPGIPLSESARITFYGRLS